MKRTAETGTTRCPPRAASHTSAAPAHASSAASHALAATTQLGSVSPPPAATQVRVVAAQACESRLHTSAAALQASGVEGGAAPGPDEGYGAMYTRSATSAPAQGPDIAASVRSGEQLTGASSVRSPCTGHTCVQRGGV